MTPKKPLAALAALAKIAAMHGKIRLAWISTYNSRCGLATHSEDLLAHFDRAVYDIAVLANHAQPVGPDTAETVRLWPDSAGSLAAVRHAMRGFDAVLVNFHPSLIALGELAETLQAAQSSGIDTYVILHKTCDTAAEDGLVSLQCIAGALRQCTALIVHSAADFARLQRFGIAGNVTMMPLGVSDRAPLRASAVRRRLGLCRRGPIIGSFGFLLPPKGLPQLVEGFGLLRRNFPEALLLLLTAEYPAAESAEERTRVLARIRDLHLREHVRLIDEFLAVDEILFLLAACDLSVFTYQASEESDSGAVRLGLAAGRPVLTTPLPIFANLSGSVHTLGGGGAADIAAGIEQVLGDRALAKALLRRQRKWIGGNSWAVQAARLDGLIRQSYAARHGAAPAMSPRRGRGQRRPSIGPMRAASLAARLAQPPPLPAADVRGDGPPRPEIPGVAIEWLPVMRVGPAGRRTAGGIVAKPGESGHLVYGPYATLAPGCYRASIHLDVPATAAALPQQSPLATIEAVAAQGRRFLAQRELRDLDALGSRHELAFEIAPGDGEAVELRVWSSGAVPLTVLSIAIERIAASPAAGPPARQMAVAASE